MRYEAQFGSKKNQIEWNKVNEIVWNVGYYETTGLKSDIDFVPITQISKGKINERNWRIKKKNVVECDRC